MPRLRSAARRLLRAVTFVAVALVVLFFAATRTQVGRDGIRDQIEGYVERELQGRLEVGALRGNLLFDLYASDVRLYAPDGGLVAAVDSVVLRPKWLALLRRGAFAVDALYLQRPRVTMHRDSAGVWDLVAALQPVAPSTEAPAPLTLRGADIEIEDGALVTTRDGAAPAFVERGALFDVTRTRVDDLDLRASLLWTPDAKRVKLDRLAADLPALSLALLNVEGTAWVGEDGVSVDRFRLVTGPLAAGGPLRPEGTRLDGYASLSGTAETPLAERVLDLRLEADRIDLDEVRRVVPASPLADALTLRLDARGPLGALEVPALRLERGATRLDATGRLSLAEGAAPLTATLDLGRSQVRQADLEALLLGVALPDYTHLGAVRVRGTADLAGRFPNGAVPQGLALDGRRWTLDADVALGADAFGPDARDAKGTLALVLPPGAPPRWRADVALDGLDLGGVLDRPALAGGLTGRVRLASLTDSTDAILRIEAALAAVRAGALRADTLAADLRVGGGAIAGRVFARQGASALDATGAVRGLGGALPRYQLDADAQRLDAQAFYASAPRTRLTGRVRLDGRGTALADLAARLEADLADAYVQLGDTLRRVATDRLLLTVAPPDSLAEADGPRVALESDLADVRLEGGLGLGDLAALGAHWEAAFARTVAAERRKARRPDASAADTLGALPSDPAPPDVVPARALRLTATLREPDSLRALLPGLPVLAADASLTLAGRAGSDTLALDLTVRDDRLAAGAFDTDGLVVEARLRSRYGPTLTDRTTLGLAARADSLLLGDQMLAAPALALDYRDGAGAVRLDAQPLYNAAARREPDSLALGRAAIAFDFAVRPEATRVTFEQAYVQAGALHWALAGAPAVDLYADAIVTDGVTLARVGEARAQRLTVAGAFSPARADTAYVEARGLDLAEVLRVVGLTRPFGGRLEGDVAIPAALGQPELEGDLRVEPFLFDGRPAGRLLVASRFRPGTTDLAVDLSLAPNPDYVEAPDARRVPVNDFDVSGTLRLPGRAADGARTAGAYDLDATFRRLDLFFFDFLFGRILEGAGGYATGTGRITGTLTRPLFEADLAIRDGRFRVPGFNLALGLEGEVDVDTEGIHIREARLSDKTGGTGRAQGSVLFNDYRFWSFDLQGALREMQIIDVAASDALPFYGDIRASGGLTLTGPIDNVFLRSTNARTTPDSELFIPVVADAPSADTGFLIFADSTGALPELEARTSLVGRRPTTERSFLEGLEMQLNVDAPPGSTVHLVLDPALGDQINAVGSGRLELAIDQGRFFTFGTFEVQGGDYLFTAGDVFTRRFLLRPGGTLRWTGEPIDARLDLAAAYETRASLAGLTLPDVENADRQRIPVVVEMQLTGTVTAPLVDLSLDLNTGERLDSGLTEALRTELNDSDQQAEYATSVLLTNSFLLAPTDDLSTVGDTADELLYASLSQLVSTRLNAFLNEALASDNVEVLFGVQQGNDFEEIDLTYGVALRFLDERLVIRGEGIYQRDASDEVQSDDFQGEVAVEVKLTPDVALEVFYRRESDLLDRQGLGATTYGAYGAGLSYQTEFASWPRLLQRLVGDAQEEAETANASAAQ